MVLYLEQNTTKIYVVSHKADADLFMLSKTFEECPEFKPRLGHEENDWNMIMLIERECQYLQSMENSDRMMNLRGIYVNGRVLFVIVEHGYFVDIDNFISLLSLSICIYSTCSPLILSF